MDVHALLGAPAPSADAPQVPPVLQQLGEELALSTELVTMLSQINVDGHQPGTREDWLFLLLATRRACRIVETLPLGAAVAVKEAD